MKRNIILIAALSLSATLILTLRHTEHGIMVVS